MKMHKNIHLDALRLRRFILTCLQCAKTALLSFPRRRESTRRSSTSVGVGTRNLKALEYKPAEIRLWFLPKSFLLLSLFESILSRQKRESITLRNESMRHCSVENLVTLIFSSIFMIFISLLFVRCQENGNDRQIHNAVDSFKPCSITLKTDSLINSVQIYFPSSNEIIIQDIFPLAWVTLHDTNLSTSVKLRILVWVKCFDYLNNQNKWSIITLEKNINNNLDTNWSLPQEWNIQWLPDSDPYIPLISIYNYPPKNKDIRNYPIHYDSLNSQRIHRIDSILKHTKSKNALDDASRQFWKERFRTSNFIITDSIGYSDHIFNIDSKSILDSGVCTETWQRVIGEPPFRFVKH